MEPNHVQQHIELIAKQEEEFLAQRSWIERMGDAISGFAGSLPFVGIHLAISQPGSP